MEDGLRESLHLDPTKVSEVLILVLVEDGLRVVDPIKKKDFNVGLNPCFSGRWSASFLINEVNNKASLS